MHKNRAGALRPRHDLIICVFVSTPTIDREPRKMVGFAIKPTIFVTDIFEFFAERHHNVAFSKRHFTQAQARISRAEHPSHDP